MTDVREATHVKLKDRSWERIVEKWGITNSGHLEPPSRGGFDVVTKREKHLEMWNAMGLQEGAMKPWQNDSPQHQIRQSEQIATPQSPHCATAGLPHGIPMSLSLETYSI
jgi:hypothetical protein